MSAAPIGKGNDTGVLLPGSEQFSFILAFWSTAMVNYHGQQ